MLSLATSTTVEIMYLYTRLLSLCFFFFILYLTPFNFFVFTSLPVILSESNLASQELAQVVPTSDGTSEPLQLAPTIVTFLQESVISHQDSIGWAVSELHCHVYILCIFSAWLCGIAVGPLQMCKALQLCSVVPVWRVQLCSVVQVWNVHLCSVVPVWHVQLCSVVPVVVVSSLLTHQLFQLVVLVWPL